MNKTELIDTIAQSASISKSDASKALMALLNTISGAVAEGDNVTLIGFGTFSLSRREARTGRNPKTGEALKIEAKKIVKFKPGMALSNAVNK